MILSIETACRLAGEKWIGYQGLERDAAKNLGYYQGRYLDPDDGLVRIEADGRIDASVYEIKGPWEGGGYGASGTSSLRVAVVGDSYTDGAGLSNLDDLFVNQAAKLLASSSARYEFLVWGQGGFNTEQEKELAEKLIIPESKPQVLVLQYTDNDIDEMRKSLGVSTDHRYFIRTRSRLVFSDGRIAPAMSFLPDSWNSWLTGRSALFRLVSYRLNIFLENTGSPTPVRSLQALTELADLSRQNGIDFVVMNFSPASDTGDYCGPMEFGGKSLHDSIRALSQAKSFTFIDMCENVSNINLLHSREEKICDYCHYNPEGHRIAGKLLAAYLQDLNKIE